MLKKHDLPAMPFYFGDWMKAPDIRALPLDVRMVWFEMLGFMWESKERGYLTINNKPIPRKNLATMLGLPEDLLEQILKQLSDFAIYSVRESDGAIYNRKMVKDNDIREKRQKAGFLGGKNSFASRFAQAKSEANTENENENENEKEIEEETTQNLWITTYGKNPNPVENKFGSTLIEKFGYKKARNILWTLNKNNFHSIAKMESVVSNTGEVILINNKIQGRTVEHNPA